MRAKKDILKYKDENNEEYYLYPKTLMECVTNENGDSLEDTVKTFVEEEFGDTYATAESVDAILNGTQRVGDSAKLGGKDASEYALGTELIELQGTQWLGTSILEKALEVDAGVHVYALSGGSYTGNDIPVIDNSLPVYSTAVIYKRTTGSIVVELHSESSNRCIKNSYCNGAWVGWGVGATIADLANYLPLTGGTVDNGSPYPLMLKNSNGEIRLPFFMGETLAGFFGFNSVNEPLFISSSGVGNTILHTGNKPTGSYTGNGEARVIQTGGIGSVCYIKTHYDTCDNFIIVFEAGAIGKDGTNILSFTREQIRFVNGDIYIGNADVYYNHAGNGYYYEVH